jgi:N-acetylglucosaminyldiphosphoundecaprenol N-acetyl-beta-D-mannosaminyltransferase
MRNEEATTPGEPGQQMASGGPTPEVNIVLPVQRMASDGGARDLNGGAPTSNGRTPHVDVGPFRVSDTPPAELVGKVVSLGLEERTQPAFAFALHVGGLNARREREFVAAMRAADVVYADGGSVVWLARLAGAHRVARAPTTDIGWEIMREFQERTGRVPRIALIGGPEGLTAGAGAVIESAGVAKVVLVEHGYHTDWSQPLADLREAAPDITVVGLGAPYEMIWCQQHRDELPTGLVLTCGGWFNYIVGDERRAPRLLRRSGLEWIARFAQSPVRLGPRYARGVGATAALTISTLAHRPSPD